MMLRILKIAQWVPAIGVLACIFMAETDYENSAMNKHTFSNALWLGITTGICIAILIKWC